MSPEKDGIIVTLSPQEVIRLEMILTDRNKEEALAFVTEIYQKIKSKTIRGLKSHLDSPSRSSGQRPAPGAGVRGSGGRVLRRGGNEPKDCVAHLACLAEGWGFMVCSRAFISET